MLLTTDLQTEDTLKWLFNNRFKHKITMLKDSASMVESFGFKEEII